MREQPKTESTRPNARVDRLGSSSALIDRLFAHGSLSPSPVVQGTVEAICVSTLDRCNWRWQPDTFREPTHAE